MKRWYLMLAVACAAGCSKPPEQIPAATPASEIGAQRRPIVMPGMSTRESTRSEVEVSPDIVAACNLSMGQFEYDSLGLHPFDGLDKVASCFISGPLADRKLKVVGHNDPRGEGLSNLDLGQTRADAVQTYLNGDGVAKDRITSTSRGSLDAKGTDEASWAQDRRVEILLGD